jgi:hypothetical protein
MGSKRSALWIIPVVAILLIVGLSFFATTWIAMVVGGSIGHIFHVPYLMRLGYWKYAPLWVLIILVKVVL